MKGQIKRVLAILFVVLFVATMTASAVSADIGDCGTKYPRWWWPHGPIIEQKDIINIDYQMPIENVQVTASVK